MSTSLDRSRLYAWLLLSRLNFRHVLDGLRQTESFEVARMLLVATVMDFHPPAERLIEAAGAKVIRSQKDQAVNIARGVLPLIQREINESNLRLRITLIGTGKNDSGFSLQLEDDLTDEAAILSVVDEVLYLGRRIDTVATGTRATFNMIESIACQMLGTKPIITR